MTRIPSEQPALIIPHDGGPCFFMLDLDGNWATMAAFLRGLPAMLSARPGAILIASGHWETDDFDGRAAPGHH